MWWEIKKFIHSLFKWRTWRFIWQRLTRGWDDSQTWSLHVQLARIIAPRLRRFKELNIGYPGGEMTWEKWNETLDKMIAAFEFFALDDDLDVLDPKDPRWIEAEEGLQLFAKYYGHLWW